MPSPIANLPQTNAQDTEKHKTDDFCAVTINETSPPMMRYVGLENQGATCYLNTVLQMLFMTEEFREAVEGYVMNNSSSPINNRIAQLFKCLKSRERNTATTEGITAELKINVHKQEDAAKCLQKILNKVDPEISKIFQGEMSQTTICINPEKVHDPLQQVKTFFILSISLNSEPPVHMQKCFDSYFAPIIMCGEDQQVYCKDCAMMMNTEIISSLQKVPSVLVLHLERFEFDYEAMCCVKNYASVQIPHQLLVKKEVAGVNHTYDLYAIANHSGSLNGGHYYADIKDENGWHRFDDSLVHSCSLKMYLTCDSNTHLVSKEAYLLLYKKRSKSTQDIFSVVNETESSEKHRKRANSLPKDYPNSLKIRRCSEHDSQSTVSNEQNHLNNSDSDSETEKNTPQIVPDDPGPDGDMKSTDADHNQPTPNYSSGETDSLSSESELNNKSEKGKDQQDRQVLLKNSDSNPDTEANASQNESTPNESTIEMQSDDADNDNRLKLLSSSADQVSEQHRGSSVSVNNFNEDNQNQSNTNNNNETKRTVMYIGISFLSVVVFLILFIVSYYCTPHLLTLAVVVLLLSLICFLVLLTRFVASYLLPTIFTTDRNDNSQRSGVI